MPYEYDYTQSIIRAALYLGVFLLLGVGVFARYVGREAALEQPRRLRYVFWSGGLLALAATLYGIYHLNWMLGDASAIAMGGFLLETAQGNWLLLRLGLLMGLLGLSLGWFSFDRWLYPPLALVLLLTLTFTSHAGAAGGFQALVGLLHLSFAVVWAGSVLALAVAWPGTSYEAFRLAITRLSRLGLAMFVGVALAGGYLALQRLEAVSQLWTTPYGQLLLLKIALVALVIGVAGVNRLWLIPRIQAGQAKGLQTVSLEAILIAGVLVASGILASTAPPT
jgi:putative copper export protein